MFLHISCATTVLLQRTTQMLGVTKITVNDFFARRTILPLESSGDLKKEAVTARHPARRQASSTMSQLHNVAATRDPWLKNFA
jgi:hypothetical protein